MFGCSTYQNGSVTDEFIKPAAHTSYSESVSNFCTKSKYITENNLNSLYFEYRTILVLAATFMLKAEP